MAPEMTAALVDMMKTEPVPINVDDNDLKRMYTLCVGIFNK